MLCSISKLNVLMPNIPFSYANIQENDVWNCIICFFCCNLPNKHNVCKSVKKSHSWILDQISKLTKIWKRREKMLQTSWTYMPFSNTTPQLTKIFWLLFGRFFVCFLRILNLKNANCKNSRRSLLFVQLFCITELLHGWQILG